MNNETHNVITAINGNSALCIEVRRIANDAHTTLDSKIEAVRKTISGCHKLIESDIIWQKVVDAFHNPASCYATNGLAEYTTDVEVSLGAFNVARVFVQSGDNKSTIGHRILDAMHNVGKPMVFDRRKVEAPIPMLLTCPIRRCGRRHIDEGEFATRSHHSHACQHCGHVFRPAIVPTVGVQFLPGFKNPK